MPLLRIKLLGSFEVWRGEERIEAAEWPTQKTQDLLKILLTVRGHVAPSERLMEWLWPDLAPASAANSLRVAVSRLRRLLQPDLNRPAESAFILTQGQGYLVQVGADVWVDVDAFEHLVGEGQVAERNGDWGRAVAVYQSADSLYRGDYLEENPYDDWAISAREQLHEAQLDLLSRLGAAHARLGHLRRALGACWRALAADPVRESIYRQTMLYHYRLGQRDQALRAFERCQQILVDTFGVDPMPETLELHARILREEPMAEAAPARAAAGVQIASDRSPAWLPFVGRQSEMDQLVDLLDAAKSGRGQVVLVAGEAGVGKSRLVEELLAFAHPRGALALVGRAYEPERELSYQPLREALRRFLLPLSSDPAALRQTLGPSAPAVGLLLPEIRQALPDLPGAEPVSPEEERGRLLEGLVQFCLSLAATAPLVLFLDDLHWADPSTLRFFHFLARRTPPHHMLLVGAYRDTDLGRDHPLWAIERQLQRENLLARIELPRLSAEVVLQLVAQKSARGSDVQALGRWLFRETEGNPLFLAESLRSLRDQGLLIEDAQARWRIETTGITPVTALPAGIHDLIAARIQALDKPAQHLLRVAAVIGRTFTFDLLRLSAQLDEAGLLDALEEAADRQLIHEHSAGDPIAFHFSHDKIREVVYAGLTAPRRQQTHLKIAAALEQLHTGHTEGVAGQLAHHWLRGGEKGRAVEYLLQAGDRERAIYAHQEAIEHYRQALAILTEQHAHDAAARTLLKLGLSHQIGFDFPAARQAYEEAFERWQWAQPAPAPLPHPADQVLRVDWPLGIKIFDPNLAWDSMSTGIVEQLFSGLAEHGAEGEVLPDVAQRWEVLDGGATYIFRLRPDVHWSDGVRVTAHDFEFSWKRVLDPATASPLASLLYDIKGARAFNQGEAAREEVAVAAVDDLTLIVELTRPVGYFPYLLGCNVTFPAPRHAVAEHGGGWAQMGAIVANGPFRLASWKPDEFLTLTRNPGYHGRFRGNVQRVELHLSADALASLQRYEAGALDILRLPYPLPPEMEDARARHAAEYVSIPTNHTIFLGFDVSAPPCDDPRLRRALALAIDRVALAHVVSQGYDMPAVGGFVPPGIPGHAPDIGLPYDPSQARELLAQTGFAPAANRPALELAASHGNNWQTIAAFLQAQWRQNLGLETHVTALAPPVFLDKLRRQAPAIFLTGWYADYGDPDNFLGANPVRRATRWRHPEYDRLVELAGQSMDQKQRMEMYRRADRILIEDAAVIPLLYTREHRLVKPWVTKLPASAIKWWFWKDAVVAAH